MKQTNTFKHWVESHNPNLDWDWTDPKEIHSQLVQTIKESGNLDFKPAWSLFWIANNSGLTLEEEQNFLGYINNN